MKIDWALEGEPIVSAKDQRGVALARCRDVRIAQEEITQMKAMILGASGLLGKALMREWTGDEVVGLGFARCRIFAMRRRCGKCWRRHVPTGLCWLRLTPMSMDARVIRIWRCAVNRDGPVNVAEAAKRIGAKLLFLSSDYVFDGKKTSPYEAGDARNPQSVYGRSKAEAEVRLLEVLPECCIARTSWLFGTGGKCFPDTILKLAATRPALDVVDDQRGCSDVFCRLGAGDHRIMPQSTPVESCMSRIPGIVRGLNLRSEIVKGAGLATEVRPVSSQQMARPAPRPAYSVLSPKSLQEYGIVMPAWQDALQRYLQERKN